MIILRECQWLPRKVLYNRMLLYQNRFHKQRRKTMTGLLQRNGSIENFPGFVYLTRDLFDPHQSGCLRIPGSECIVRKGRNRSEIVPEICCSPASRRVNYLFGRGGVAKRPKATVCKTVIRRFESGRRLSSFPREIPVIAFRSSALCPRDNEAPHCLASFASYAATSLPRGVSIWPYS